jgi:hypothetical protein
MFVRILFFVIHPLSSAFIEHVVWKKSEPRDHGAQTIELRGYSGLFSRIVNDDE